MGKVRNGILSHCFGRVGNVVFADYMGRQTVRKRPEKYTSNSPAQITQREKVAIFSYFGSIMPEDLFPRFWKYKNLKLTPRNNWLSFTLNSYIPTIDPQYFYSSRGKLETPYPWANSTYDSVTGVIHIKSNANVFSSGLLTDQIYLSIFWADTKPVLFIKNDIWTRAKAFWNVPFIAGLNPAYIGIYWTAYRGEGRNIEVSNSVYQTVIAV